MIEWHILLAGIFWIALLNLIWFDSSAFEEYSELFGANKFFKIEAWKEARKSDFTLTYHNYLLLKHGNFFIRLITCQLCLTIWFSILYCLHYGVIYFPFVSILSYSLYGGVIKLNERR